MIFSKISPRFIFGASLMAVAILVMSIPSFANAYTLTRQLELEMSGPDVSALQTFLATDPKIYPQGLVTGYFGFLTKAAVSNFQSKNGIDPVGRVGPMTLPVLNAQMAGGINSGLDVSAPVITSVNVNTTNTTAVVSWTTNDFARGKFYYSTTPIVLTNTFEQTGLNFIEPTVVNANLGQYDGVTRMSQAISISGLLPNTTYFYLVVVLDSSNNSSITSPAFFRTAQ